MDIKEAREEIRKAMMEMSKKEIIEFSLDIIVDGYPDIVIKYAKKIGALGY